MNLYALLKVLDADVIFQIEYKYDTVFQGTIDEFKEHEKYDRHEIKCVWYSKLNNALVIEI